LLSWCQDNHWRYSIFENLGPWESKSLWWQNDQRRW
jgi:hypothetical protein